MKLGVWCRFRMILSATFLILRHRWRSKYRKARRSLRQGIAKLEPDVGNREYRRKIEKIRRRIIKKRTSL